MVYTPHTRFRSEAARLLAERVESGAGLDSLDVKVNINQVLSNRSASEVPQQVHEAIVNNRNFVLFSDKDHYIIIIPCKLAVACFVDDVQQTMEVMKDMQQFQNRVKLAFVVYDRFYEIDRLVEGGGNSNGALPLHTNGENMRDGKEGT